MADNEQYLQDAKHQLDRSYGDVRDAAFAEHLRMMALVSALISIAASLDELTTRMEEVSRNFQDFNLSYQEAFDREKS